MGIESLLGSWGSISTTIRCSSKQYFRNWRRTEGFRIGYWRGCAGHRIRATSHGEEEVSGSLSERSVCSVKTVRRAFTRSLMRRLDDHDRPLHWNEEEPLDWISVEMENRHEAATFER